MSGFSETSEAGNAIAPCDESIIPIFPLRYALSLDMLKSLPVTDAQRITISPTTILNHPGMELLRIRQGYIFIYAENHRGQGSEPTQVWQTFRYETDGEDDNSSTPRGDTQLQSRYSGGYKFLKYRWKDGTAEGDWDIPPSERSYPYAFVSSQTTTIWVAYSEHRWPAKFFERAANDMAFREDMMARVEVQSQSGHHAAPLSQLAELAPIFRSPNVNKPALDIPAENALRHTAIESEQMSDIVHCRNSREKGIVVALKDPIGEHLDVGRLIAIHATTRTAFMAEHQYPVVIGRAIENLVEQEQVSAESWLPSWLVSVPLSPEYKDHFSKIDGTLTELESQETKLIGWFRGMLSREYRGTISYLLTQAHTAAAAQPVGGHNYQDCLAYAMLTLQRTFSLITGSQLGSNCALAVIGNEVQDDAAVAKFVDLVQKILEQVAKVVDGSISAFHKAFLPSLEVTFSVFGKEIALAGTRFGRPSGARTITLAMFHQNVGTVSSAGEISAAFQRMLTDEGFSSIPSADVVFPRDVGEVASVRVGLSTPETPRIGLVEFESRIDFMANSETIERLNRKARFERLGNGIGLVASFLSLYTTLNNLNAGSYSQTDVGQHLDDPKVKLLTGFADAYSATVGIYQARAVTNSTATSRALEIIFKNNTTLARAVNVSVASAGRATRFLQISGKLAGVIGIAVSFGMAFEGARRGDRAMLVGHSMMAIGALVLLSATGVGAAIALIAIVAGFLISLASMNEIELWVNTSFYGQSGEYWGGARRSIADNTNRARALAYKEEADNEYLRLRLDDELADYIDRTSSLQITNDSAGDRAFEIHCGIIQTPDDMSKIAVTVTYEKSWSLRRDRGAAGVQKIFVSSGLVKVIPRPPDSDNWSNIDIEVSISRRNGGEHSESASFDVSEL